MAKATRTAARAATIPTPPVEKPKASTETVSVACKLPHGLILRIFKMVPSRETAPGGYRDIQKAEVLPGQVHINGNALAFGEQPSYRILGGYAITENVPKDFFETWLKQNPDMPAVVNKLIFAVGRGDEVAPAREHENVRSGLEPLLQDKDPRAPKKIEAAKTKVD